jgi:capsular polysaccharide biosynthesis protein
VFASLQEWRAEQAQAAQFSDLIYREAKPVTQPGGHTLFVVDVPGAKVVGDARLVSTADDEVIGGVQALHGISDPASHWTVRQRRWRLTRRLPGRSMMLAASGAVNYYHWLFDSLPRLHLAKLAGFGPEEIDQYLLNESLLPVHRETLSRLGISAAKWVCCSRRRILETERLLLTAMPTAASGCCPRWVRDFLRGALLPPEAGHGGDLVYVSRRSAKKRRLLNESDLEDCLRRRGFSIVSPESLSFADQAAVFASARVIVAPHGAGLANLVFARPGALVIELLDPDFNNMCYRDLSSTCELDHRQLTGVRAGRAPARSDKRAAFTIDIPEVMRTLSKEGCR